MSKLFTGNEQLKHGMLVDGTMDGAPFVNGMVRFAEGMVFIDHKSFPNEEHSLRIGAVNQPDGLGGFVWSVYDLRPAGGEFTAPSPKRSKPEIFAIWDGIEYTNAHAGNYTTAEHRQEINNLQSEIRSRRKALRRHASLAKKLGWKEAK